MKGVVKYELGMHGVELRELPEPIPKEGECKVKVLAASICGSCRCRLRRAAACSAPNAEKGESKCRSAA